MISHGMPFLKTKTTFVKKVVEEGIKGRFSRPTNIGALRALYLWLGHAGKQACRRDTRPTNIYPRRLLGW